MISAQFQTDEQQIMPIEIQKVEAPTEEVRTLIAELDAELNANYSPEQRHGLDLSRIFQPHIAFFIAHLNGHPAGCGGVAFEHNLAEVKRMYVRPHARGQNVGQTILARLESEAKAHGIPRMVLETGDVQQAAIKFYQRAGYTPCAAFAPYATMPAPQIERSRFFEKHLGL
jgi:putative acetyltransferase